MCGTPQFTVSFGFRAFVEPKVDWTDRRRSLSFPILQICLSGSGDIPVEEASFGHLISLCPFSYMSACIGRISGSPVLFFLACLPFWIGEFLWMW